MILAAGLGSRLRPYTNKAPKPLIQVQGQALIDHHLLALAQAGFESVVINVFHLADQVQAHVGDGSRFGIPVVYSDERATGLLGVYGGVHHALPLLGGAPFALLSADIFTDFPWLALRKRRPDVGHVVLVPNPPWHPAGDFALCDGCLAATLPRPYTYANIGVFQPTCFAQPDAHGGRFGEWLRHQCQAGAITAEVYGGQWHNVGTLAQWQAVASDSDVLR